MVKTKLMTVKVRCNSVSLISTCVCVSTAEYNHSFGLISGETVSSSFHNSASAVKPDIGDSIEIFITCSQKVPWNLKRTICMDLSHNKKGHC